MSVGSVGVTFPPLLCLLCLHRVALGWSLLTLCQAETHEGFVGVLLTILETEQSQNVKLSGTIPCCWPCSYIPLPPTHLPGTLALSLFLLMRRVLTPFPQLQSTSRTVSTAHGPMSTSTPMSACSLKTKRRKSATACCPSSAVRLVSFVNNSSPSSSESSTGTTQQTGRPTWTTQCS